MIKRLIIWWIRGYQVIFSPDKNILVRLGIRPEKIACAFYPTCSEYMIMSIEKYGVIQGIKKGLKRILRCRKGTPLSVDLP
ncbi:MAG: membrane protein insertion efficiency factor YidD [Candidatus Yonathbacteria bacterium]|nr:membrane protein insertion efficiency factor YidD [Candidatus Yonathbacteria bacterium]